MYSSLSKVQLLVTGRLQSEVGGKVVSVGDEMRDADSTTLYTCERVRVPRVNERVGTTGGIKKLNLTFMYHTALQPP